MNKFLKTLEKKDAFILYNESLKKHCSFGIGGIAKIFIYCNNVKTLKLIHNNFKKYYIIGYGTNVLFDDKKNKIPFVKLDGYFKKISFKGIYVTAGAGVNLFKLNCELKEKGLGGLEFTYGIPGSVGGAIFMNAGAFGQEIGNYVSSVKVFDGKKIFWTNSFQFFYRNSSFKKKNLIILSVKFKLFISNKEKIEKLQNKYFLQRKASQPYDKKSAGSVFKRIYFENKLIIPAKIIDNLGLKGVKINDAQVSEKHAGFIINNNNAKFKDVIKLILKIKKTVKNKAHINLEEEIVILKGKTNVHFGRLSYTHNI